MAVFEDWILKLCGAFSTIFALFTILPVYVMAAEAEVTDKQQFERSLPSDGVSLVVVKVTAGDVRISSWERPEVLVKEAEIAVERIEDRIEIATKESLLPALLKQAKARVECNISVPEDMDLDVKCIGGSVYITGNRGKEKITTMNGDIELKNIAGSVSAKTTSGDIYAEILFDDESSFFAADGSIDIHIGDDFSVPISAHAVSGSINIAIPEGYSADVDAEAQLGQVRCDFPLDGSVKRGSLRGRLFGGGPLLKLRTISGDIAIVGMTHVSPIHHAEAVPEAEREIPRVEATKTLNTPVIDGRLDDECWKTAGRIENFVWADGVEKPHEPTEAYLLWDDRNLYIGIKCYESYMDAIRISNTEADNEAREDDIMQIFIDATPETEADYYHIAINPIGVVFDQEISEADVSDREIRKSELGVKWNSNCLSDTDIRKSFWSIEAGIPFSAFKVGPKEGDMWRFNLYRVERRADEHTYWSPTYDWEEWPHVPARFGKLAFAAVQLIGEKSTERALPSEEALAIAGITVEGNNQVSQEEILEAMKLKPGDLADVDILLQAKLRLGSLGWFRNVSMDLTENDKGVDLAVRVVEKDIISPSKVQIRGSVLFTEEQIIDYFNFRPARTTKEDVDIKSRLIEKLYKAKGYEMTAVSSSDILDVLVIDIDEGHIDRVEVRGNNKVRAKDIIKALDLEPGAIYKKNEIDNAVYTMKARLPYFREVSWEPGRSGDGLNMIYIDVQEDDLIKTDLDGIGDFNRVHGLQLGLGSELKSTYGMARGYCKFSYGFSSEIWNYQFGMEKSWFRKHKSTIGIDVHRITDTNDRELISDAEQFIAEAILGEAWRDFYQRDGYELNFGQKLTPSNGFGLRYRDDEYTSLEKTNDWSLLNRSYTDDDWSDEFRWAGSRSYSREIYRSKDEKYKPANPPIDEGRMRSVIVEYSIDTRNSKKDPTSGWLNIFSVEYAGGDKLGGDFNFAIYQGNIRRYDRLSGNQFFAFRIKAATADRELSVLHPRKLYLGGIGTLRGYGFKEFPGDKMLLINAEYWVMTDWPLGIGMVFFVDSGYAWPYESEISVDDIKTDIGVGFQLGGLRINLASPIRERDKEAVLSARLARMF